MQTENEEKFKIDKTKSVPQVLDAITDKILSMQQQISDANFQLKISNRKQEAFESKLSLQRKQIIDELEPTITKIQNELRVNDINLSKKVSNNTHDLGTIKDKLITLENGLKDTKVSLLDKATMQQLNKIEEIIAYDLLKNLKFQDFKRQYEISTKQISQDISELQQKITNFKQEQYDKIEELDATTLQTKCSLLEQIGINQDNSKQLTIQQNQLDYIIQQCKYMNETFESKANFQILKSRFDIFSSIETIKEIREVFLPKIQGFLGHIDRMEESHKMMTSCILKFDEDLSLKYDKSSFLIFKKELEANYIKNDYKNQVDLGFSKCDYKMQDNQKQTEEKLEKMMQEFKQENLKSIRKEINNKLKEYENVAKSFKQFFGQEELGALIDRKADLELFRRLQDKKASKREVNQLEKLLKTTENQIRHISVLQTEIAQSLIQNDSNNRNSNKLYENAVILQNLILKQSNQFELQKKSSAETLANKLSFQKQNHNPIKNEASIELSGSSIHSAQESIVQNQIFIRGSTSKNRKETVKVVKEIFSQESQRVNTSQSKYRIKINSNKPNQLLSDSILSNTVNSPSEKTYFKKQNIQQKRQFINIDLKKKKVADIKAKQNFRNISQIIEEFKTNSNLNILSDEEEILSSISQLNQNRPQTTMNHNQNSILSGNLNEIQNKKFIRFEEQSKKQNGKISTNKRNDNNIIEANSMNIFSLNQKLKNKMQQQKQIGQKNVNFKTLVDFSNQLLLNSRNQKPVQSRGRTSPQQLSHESSLESKQIYERVYSPGQFKQSKIREQFSNNFSLGKSKEIKSNEFNLRYKNQNVRKSYINDQIYNSNIFDINNVNQSGVVNVNEYKNDHQDQQNNIFE